MYISKLLIVFARFFPKELFEFTLHPEVWEHPFITLSVQVTE